MKPPKSIGTILHGWTYDMSSHHPILFDSRKPCKGCGYGEFLPNAGLVCKKIHNCAAITLYSINKKYERFRYALT